MNLNALPKKAQAVEVTSIERFEGEYSPYLMMGLFLMPFLVASEWGDIYGNKRSKKANNQGSI